MNIINTLTLRHIKTHKKRSILTVLAIIVSVAMVSAVFTSAISFVKYFQNATVAIDGNWHVRFDDKNFPEHQKVYENDENIKSYGVRTYLGKSTDFKADQSHNMYKTNDGVQVFSVSSEWFKLRNVVVSVGKYPQNSNEIMLCEKLLEKSGRKIPIGSNLKLNIKTDVGKSFEKEFLVVGYTKSEVSATDNTPFFTGTDKSSFENVDSALVMVEYDKLDNSIWEKIEKTVGELGINSGGDISHQSGDGAYATHSDLFMYSGVLKDNSILLSLGGFAGILLLIIVIVSVFMIYDSFAVSYQEREKYLGMLASVGATKRQKRMSVYFEGFILGLIGIPLGVISGIGGIYVVFRCIEDIMIGSLTVDYVGSLKVYVNLIVVLGTLAISALTIFVSSYIPARKASRTSAIEAIKQSNTVKVKKAKKLKASKLSEKLFGYEGALAVKNYKRNGRRSRNITFALALSAVVFLSTTSFSAMLKDVLVASYARTADTVVTTDAEHYNLLEKAVKENKKVKSAYFYAAQYGKLDLSFFKEDEAQKIKSEQNNIAFVFLDNASLDGYLKSLGEDSEKFHNKNAPAAILQNISFNSVNRKSTSSQPIKDIEGKKIRAEIVTDSVVGGKSAYKNIDFDIGVQTSKLWDEESFYYQYSNLPVIMMSVDFIGQVFNGDDRSPVVSAMIFSDSPEEAAQEIADKISSGIGDEKYVLSVSDPAAEAKLMNNTLTVAKVFIYGFITLITIIAVMNIINTISNSMNERRREFAMIRSVGMTPKSFKKMIYLEAIRYGARALAAAIPISVLIHYAMYRALAGSFDFGFNLHLLPYALAAAGVFAVVALALLYSSTKIKDDNIIETLKGDLD